MKRVAVLISGRGSNLGALIAAQNDSYKIVLVISNNPDAAGLARAADAGIATMAIAHTGKTREGFDAEIDAALRAAGVEIVVLAGFMRILSDGFVRGWEGAMINIHPSLLPAYKGTKVHERVIAAGETSSGASVHFVVPELDAGPVIAQAIVHRPAVLILDEPAAGLDPQARRDLSQLLLSLKAGGMTLVVSSHILAELEDYSDRMIIVDHGRIAGGETIALREPETRLRITLAAPRDDLTDFLVARGLIIAETAGNHALVSLDGGAGERAALLAALVQAGFAVSGFTEDARNLEEVYFSRVEGRS